MLQSVVEQQTYYRKKKIIKNKSASLSQHAVLSGPNLSNLSAQKLRKREASDKLSNPSNTNDPMISKKRRLADELIDSTQANAKRGLLSKKAACFADVATSLTKESKFL